MRLKTVIASLALSVASIPAMAIDTSNCSDSFSLGVVSVKGYKSSGNVFESGSPAKNFTDCYSFQLSQNTNAWSLIDIWNYSNDLSVNLTSVRLLGSVLPDALSLSSAFDQYDPIEDHNYSIFGLGSLKAGTYILELTGNLYSNQNNHMYDFGELGYNVQINTDPFVDAYPYVPASTVASPTPEPSSYVMLALGLGAVGLIAHRRQS